MNTRYRLTPFTIISAFLLVLMFLPLTSFAQKFEGLAQTPPMGWNSWNTFGCNVNDQLIKDMADTMVESGMRDAGYTYVNIDDCWQGERDDQGFIHADPKKFPSGIKALADYVHSKGLKLGIYSDAGALTCGGYPGSQGHEYQDALTYAKWGIDYLKYDWCHTGTRNAQEAYQTMSKALKKAGRPIVFSLCEWGQHDPWTWAKEIGHLWRTTGDITNCFDCKVNHGGWTSNGVLSILDQQQGLRRYSGPGHWNDPDMLEVGNGMTASEDRAHFSLWALLDAPLIAGNDLRNMSDQTRDILTNKEVIAFNQDTLGIQGFPYIDRGEIEIWVKPLSGGDWAFAILNRSETPRDIHFDWSKHTIRDGMSNHTADFNKDTFQLRDVWAHKTAGSTDKPLDVEVPVHAVKMYRLVK